MPTNNKSGVADPSREVADYGIEAWRLIDQNSKVDDPASAKDRIISATTKKVHLYGLANASIASIVRLSHTSVGQVSHCFPTKTDLLTETLRVAFARNASVMSQRLTERGTRYFQGVLNGSSDAITPFLNICRDSLESPETSFSTEISVACRTDKKLWLAVGPVFNQQNQLLKMVLNAPLPEAMAEICPDFPQRAHLALATMIGLSVIAMTDKNHLLVQAGRDALDEFLLPQDVVRRVQS